LCLRRCVLNADAREKRSPYRDSPRENCLQWRRPIAEVALYAQMNELQHEEYNFKGTRFPLALLAFIGETNRGEARGMERAELRETSRLRNKEQTKGKKPSVPSKRRVARRKPSAFQRSCKVYFVPYGSELLLSLR